VGSVIYGGQAITDQPEETFEHMIRVERIVDNLRDRFAQLSVTDCNGCTQYRLDATNDSLQLGQLRIVLIAIRHVLGADGQELSLARIGLDAPRNYRVVRDNAKRRE
jgi:hypothetical protein